MGVQENVDFDDLVQADEPAIEFEDDGKGDDEDVVIVPPGGEAPVDEDEGDEVEGGGEAPAPNGSAGLDQAAISQAFRDGFAELGKTIKSGGSGDEAAPVQKPGESDADFRKRFEKDLFYSKGKAYDAVVEAVRREVGPVLANIQQQTANLSERSFASEPSRKKYYDQYKDEIRGWLRQNIPPANQNDPRALEMAYNSVIANHQSDIIEMEVQARMEAARKDVGKKPVYQSGSGAGGQSGTKKKKRRVVTLSAQDVGRMTSLGLDEKTYVKYYK